jgi:drug/metabolite transporter (DMT)-like permease
LGTGLAYHLYFRLVDAVGVNRAVTVPFLVPAFALVWGAAFLGERVQPASLLGEALILGGLRLARRVDAAGPRH